MRRLLLFFFAGVTLCVLGAAVTTFGFSKPVVPPPPVSIHAGEKTPPGADPQVLLSVPGLLDETKQTLTSRSGVVIHVPSGRVLAEQNAFQPFPVASLTKLMSGMVALDNNIALEKTAFLQANEYTIGGNLRIAPLTETVTIHDLFFASITGSANNAALAIARLSNIPEDMFVQEMNRKAVTIGLLHASFVEPSGLSPRNTASAYDVARMAGEAFAHYPIIADAASRATYEMHTVNTARNHSIKNPNDLFTRHRGEFEFSKTGYLDEALYCLVIGKNTPQGLLVAVTLGNPNKDTGEEETLALLQKGEERLGALATPRPSPVQ